MMTKVVKIAAAVVTVASVSLGGFFLDDRFVKAEDLKQVIVRVNQSLKDLHTSQKKLSIRMEIENKKAQIREIQMNLKRKDCGNMSWLCDSLKEEIRDLKHGITD